MATCRARRGREGRPLGDGAPASPTQGGEQKPQPSVSSTAVTGSPGDAAGALDPDVRLCVRGDGKEENERKGGGYRWHWCFHIPDTDRRAGRGPYGSFLALSAKRRPRSSRRRLRAVRASTSRRSPGTRDGEVVPGCELGGDVGDGDDPLRIAEIEEEPLVGASPGEQQPFAVGRVDDVVEAPGAGEGHWASAARARAGRVRCGRPPWRRGRSPRRSRRGRAAPATTPFRAGASPARPARRRGRRPLVRVRLATRSRSAVRRPLELERIGPGVGLEGDPAAVGLDRCARCRRWAT